MQYAHDYGICATFYCISLKHTYAGGGYNAARGLISRDIATFKPGLQNFLGPGLAGSVKSRFFTNIDLG